MKYTDKWSFPLFTAGEEGYSAFRIPAVITLPGCRILAFAEGRRNSLSDSGAIDIVEKISTDGGRTFGPLRVAISGGKNTAGNPCPVYDTATGRIVMLFNRNEAQGPERLILQGKAPRTVHMTESTDMGDTWTPERDITAETKLPLWTWHATGPCHAVQLPSGRLVVPCNHAVLDPAAVKSGPYLSHTLYSDDHGASWKIGADVAENTNECTLAPLKDGSLLINMRTFTKEGCRALAASKDGGETFAEFRMERALPEPCCQGSMLSVDRNGEEIILFSNPAHVSERIRLAIHESRDGGKTWTEEHILTEACAAYSDLTQIDENHFAVLFETGAESPYERIEWRVLSAD